MLPCPRSRWLTLLALAAACGRIGGGDDDDDPDPGQELGPCVQGRFCESPLQCEAGICVDPDQLGDTGNATPGVFTISGGDTGEGEGGATTFTSSEGSMSETGDPTGAGTGGDAEIYCSLSEGSGCICGHTADYGPLGAACSPAVLPSPARCCSNAGWPAYGGCSCWTLSCRQLSSDTCYCGLGQPDATETPVASCSAGAGVCCFDPSLGTCACYTSITSCLEGDQIVASCAAESLGCGDDAPVAACN